MALRAAYVTLVLIWSTTPLALQWSTEEVGFLFAAMARMALGLICVLTVAMWRGQRLRCDRQAVTVYAAAALGIYGAMIGVYWSTQHIPSGWIAIVFGMAPLFTTVFAALLLGERSFSVLRLLGLLSGLAGLGTIFYTGFSFSPLAALGILAVGAGTALHALSAVLVKRVNRDLPALSIAAGGLALALLPYTLTWWWLDGSIPARVPLRPLLSMLYLGVVATTVGFSLYFYVLRHQTPTQVALISFVSPITALVLGNLFNDEAFDARILAGAGLVLLALFLHEILPAMRRRQARPVVTAMAEG